MEEKHEEKRGLSRGGEFWRNERKRVEKEEGEEDLEGRARGTSG